MATSDAAVLDIQPNDQTDAESALQFQEFSGSTSGNLSRSGSASLKNEQIHNFTDFPDTAISDYDDDDTENAELIKDGKGSSEKSATSFWSLSYYQSFFDVDTNQVMKRIMWSMIPNPKSNFLSTYIRPNPDLYGPFWICATLIFTTAISGNLANYLQRANAGNYVWKYDFHKVSIAATVIFVYASLVPLALWVTLWYRKSEAKYTLLEVLCIYGYSLSIYVPLSILWTVPIEGLRWTLVFVGAATSGSVLLLTMWPAFKEDTKKISLIVMALILALHFLLAVGFVMYFFRFAPDKSSTTIANEVRFVSPAAVTNKLVNATVNVTG